MVFLPSLSLEMKQGEGYALPWTEDKWEIISQDVPSIAVTCTVLAVVPFRSRRPQGGICTFKMSFSQAADGRGMRATVVPCVFAELLVSSHAGVMLVHHSALFTRVGRVHPFLVPPLAVGSCPFILDTLIPEPTAHGNKGVCSHASTTP